MFRAEILWLKKGPSLKLEGKLVGEWAEQARRLVTTDVIPKRLIVDLTEVTYIDSAGEGLLIWLASVGAVFAARGVYTTDVCKRLGLSPMHRTSARRHANEEEKPSMVHADAGPGRYQREEE